MDALMRCIAVTARCASLQRSRELKELGLTGNQHTYILNICRHPGMTQESLAQMIYVHKSNVARQVAALCQAGFIHRQPSQADKRELLLYPTSKAEAALPVIRRVLKSWNGYLMEEFTPEEQEALLAMMNRVMARARSWADAEGCGE